jgi:hypothetical protein
MEVAYSLDKFPSRIRKMIKTPPVFWQFSTTSRVSTMNTTRKRKRSKKEKKEKKKKQKKLGTPKDKIVRVAEAVEESGPMVYKSLKSKRSKKEKKKKKEKLEAPKDKTVSATQVAEAVEKYGQMVYESLKPSVRRQLAKDYGLWVGRKDKKWVVQLDPPRSVEDVVRDMLETDEQVMGDWTPKERSAMTQSGIMVIKKNGRWCASLGCPKINKMIGKMNAPTNKITVTGEPPARLDSIKMYQCHAIPKDVIRYYKFMGFSIEPFYHYGCIADDPWNPCDCYSCQTNEKTLEGYEIFR